MSTYQGRVHMNDTHVMLQYYRHVKKTRFVKSLWRSNAISAGRSYTAIFYVDSKLTNFGADFLKHVRCFGLLLPVLITHWRLLVARPSNHHCVIKTCRNVAHISKNRSKASQFTINFDSCSHEQYFIYFLHDRYSATAHSTTAS